MKSQKIIAFEQMVGILACILERISTLNNAGYCEAILFSTEHTSDNINFYSPLKADLEVFDDKYFDCRISLGK